MQVYGFPKPAIPVWRALTTNKKLLCNVNFRLVVQDAILNFKLTYSVWKKWPVCQIDWTIHVSVLQFYNQCTCLLHTHTHTHMPSNPNSPSFFMVMLLLCKSIYSSPPHSAYQGMGGIPEEKHPGNAY